MRRLAAIGLCLIATGCGTRVVLTVPRLPGFGEAAAGPRPEAGCRYLNILVDYSTRATGMSAQDVALSARVAEAMKQELGRLGARVTEEPAEAYWSLMLLAVHNERDGGFIFSAMLALRDLAETRDPGIATYAKPGKDDAKPTMYTGVSYGSHQDVERLAREYVRKADAALLPSARELCEFEAQEARRHTEVDDQVPHPDLPL
jgi:hypothetical protein